MQFLSIVARRIVYGAVLLLAVIVLNFVLIHLAPGDPAEVIAGEMGGATPELLASLRTAYGLDQPLYQQLWIYLSRIVHGDLGYSFFFNAPVTALILQRVPATLLLVLVAISLALVVGTALGIAAARRPNGAVSHIVTVLALAGYAAPVFWMGIMLLILFASVLPIFPVSGMRSIGANEGPLGQAMDIAHHLVLPAFTLAIIYIAQFSRLTRASMLDVLGADYIRTARAKGLSERKVVYKHALRNALLPVVTIAGLHVANMLAGAVLVETVYNWPGMGRLAFESILRRDHPTILGILFFSALIVILANILTDLSYRLIDPRINAGQAS